MDVQDPGNNRASVELPVRSRWTPKQEQIMILESIFNSGMVNPPKEETVRIRKLLEKFGSVGDANVFYWFQNRRSRSRRRLRQIQTEQQQQYQNKFNKAQAQVKAHYSHNYSGGPPILYQAPAPAPALVGGAGQFSAGSSSTFGSVSGFEDHIYGYNNNSGQNQMCNFPEVIDHSSTAIPSLAATMDMISNSLFHHRSGLITVFINGIQSDVPSGAIDMKAMFGENCALVHSSGITVPFNEYGFLLQSLQHGESYFLVTRGA